MKAVGAAILLAIGVTFVGLGAIDILAEPPPPAHSLVAPYPFTRTPSTALDEEIAFYRQRTEERPMEGLDQAFLAALYLQKGRRSYQAGWLLLAEQTARRSLRNLPVSNPGALVVLARLAEQRHDFRESLRLAERALHEGRGTGAVEVMITSNLGLGRVGKAARLADLLARRQPSVESLTLRALARLATGRDEEAVHDFQDALRRESPEEAFASSRTRALLARHYLQRGRLTLARDLAQEALRITPELPLAMSLLGDCAMAAGTFDEADARYLQAYGVGHQATLLLARALARQAAGARSPRFLNEAEAALREEVRTGANGHRRDLARLLLIRAGPRPEGRPEADEALRLARAEAALRRDALTLDVLARALLATGHADEARRVIREALATGVRDARLLQTAADAAPTAQESARLRAEAVSVNPLFARTGEGWEEGH